jgi:hypothetical protein
MSDVERRPKVIRGDNGAFRISSIRSDTDSSVSLCLNVTDGGDVGIGITDPKRGMISVDLAPRKGGGANPDVTAKIRACIVELANLIEEPSEE